MVKAFSTPAPASHSLMASSASACSMLLIAGWLQPLQGVLQQTSHALQLRRRFGLAAAAQAELLQAQQVLAELRGGALGGRAGIVQLVHEAGGKRAQRDELLAVQRLNLVGLIRCALSARMVLRTAGQQASRDQKSCSLKRTSTESCAAETRNIAVALPVSKGTSPNPSPACRIPTSVQGSIRLRALGADLALEHEPVEEPRLPCFDEHGAGFGRYAFDALDAADRRRRESLRRCAFGAEPRRDP